MNYPVQIKFTGSLLKIILIHLSLILSCISYAGDPKISLQTGHNFKIVQLGFSQDGNFLGSLSEDHTVILWDTKSGRQLMKVNEGGTRVNGFAFHPHQKRISRIENDRNIITTDFSSDSIVKITLGRNDSLMRIFSIDKLNEFLVVDSTGITRYDSEFQTVKQTFKTEDKEIITEIFLSADQEKIYLMVKRNPDSKFVIKMGLRCLSTKDFEVQKQGTLNFPIHTNINPNSKITFAGNNYLFVKEVQLLYKYQILLGEFILVGKYSVSEKWKNHISTLSNLNEQVICGMNNGDIQMYNSLKNKASMVLKGHSDAVSSITTDPNGKYIVSGDASGLILLWNASDGKLIQAMEGQSESISCLSFNNDKSKMVIGYMNGDLKFWDRFTQEVIKINLESDYLLNLIGFQYVITEISPLTSDSLIEFKATYSYSSKKGSFERLTFYNGKWHFRSGKVELEEVGTDFENKITILTPIEAGKINYNKYPENPYLKDSSSLGWKIKAYKKSVIVTNPSGEQFIFQTNHQTEISFIKLFDNYFITAAWDGTIKEWNLKTGKENICYGISGRSGFFYLLPNGNYYTSKSALKFLAFRIKDQIFPFDQFDLLFNRPDQILDSLPFIEDDVVDQFHRAYVKRISRVKSKLNRDDLTKNIPVITVSEIPRNVKTGKINVSISASDNSENKISVIHVLVNGVSVQMPEFSPMKQVTSDITINLNYEENIITIYAENTAGLNSLKQEFKILNTEKIRKPNLYLITIGSGKFSDQKYNLTFASKDAIDVHASFKKNRMYGDVYELQFIDETVKPEVLAEIKSFLFNSKENDHIILFYAGHGVLDKDFNYYLSTSETDFNQPEKNSILYSDLEKTINSFLPRQKLMIIDACHSGEIDKEDIREIKNNNAVYTGKIKFRGNTTLTGTGALELSKILFTDTESKDGTAVISSSGGGELSIEGEKWNNGLFTYALLKGMKEKKSDFNSDGILTVSELQQFVNKTVYSLSSGSQNPNARSENIRNDFMIRK